MVPMTHVGRYVFKSEHYATVGPGKHVRVSGSRDDDAERLRKLEFLNCKGNQRTYSTHRTARMKNSWVEVVTSAQEETSQHESVTGGSSLSSCDSIRADGTGESSLSWLRSSSQADGVGGITLSSEACPPSGKPANTSGSVATAAKRTGVREAEEQPDLPSCSICTENLDETDSQFLPCSCGFRICLFCHHRISTDDGRCPGCRKVYNKAVRRATLIKIQ